MESWGTFSSDLHPILSNSYLFFTTYYWIYLNIPSLFCAIVVSFLNALQNYNGREKIYHIGMILISQGTMNVGNKCIGIELLGIFTNTYLHM